MSSKLQWTVGEEYNSAWYGGKIIRCDIVLAGADNIAESLQPQNARDIVESFAVLNAVREMWEKEETSPLLPLFEDGIIGACTPGRCGGSMYDPPECNCSWNDQINAARGTDERWPLWIKPGLSTWSEELRPLNLFRRMIAIL